MVTQSAIPDTTNLGQPETWRGLIECVVAARVPILVAAVYCVFLLMPDQTAEVIRSTFETTTWESRLELIPVLIFWWLFNFYIVIAFDLATRVALHHLNEKRHKERKLNGTQARIVQAVALSPVAALWAAFAQSLGPNVLAPLMNWKAILFLLAVTVVAVGWPFLKEKDEREGGSPGSNLRMLEGSAIFVWIILLLVLAALRIISFIVGAPLDPPAILIFTGWIIVLIAIVTWLTHLSNMLGAPVISLLVIWALLLAAFEVSDNHVVRTIASSAPEPLQVDAAFDAWINEQDRAKEVKKYGESNRNYPVFLIAAEGGGSRAAYMTALVLEALRQYCPDAIRHTFLIVGVSGGSVGALLASAGMKWDEQKLGMGCKGKLELAGPETPVTNAAGVDFLRPVLRGLLFGDIPARIIPSSLFFTPFFAWWTDPAQYLEIGIDRAWRGSDKSNEKNQHSLSNTGFRELWTGASSAAPALMLLTTDVTSGRRVAVSHLTTRIAAEKLPANSPASKSTCVHEAQGQGLESRARLLTLDDLLPRIEVPAATAAVLSARFPGITAPGRLPCSGPARRLVDGGYFENSGLTTVLELLGENQPYPATETQLRQRAKGVSFVVVQIESGRASSDWSFAKGERPSPPSGWLPELMSPGRTIVAVRQARADIARVALKKSVPSEVECRSQPSCDFRVLFELRPCRTPIPLGWSLSEAAQTEIRRQLFDPRANGAEQECIDGVHTDMRPPATDMPNVTRFQQIFEAARTN